MFIDRMKQLGLDRHLSLQGQDFQRAMGADLRRLVFQYIQGKLPVEDGPAVKRLREHAIQIGGMDTFIREQSPNGAWANDIELSLLAELLDVNFVVQFNEGTTTVLHTVGEDQPIVALRNTNNRDWDALILNKQKDTGTVHDGNCGYHAFARAIEPYAKVELAPAAAATTEHNAQFEQELRKQEAVFRRPIEHYRLDQELFNTAHERLKQENPEEYERRVAQIDSDYQLALRVMLSDLPGTTGRSSSNHSIVSDEFTAPSRVSCR